MDRDTLPQVFESQAARASDAIALVFEGQHLTYGVLNARANRFARLLVERSVRPEHLVAVAINRSLELIVALLGILKAGAAYLPVDTTYPQERWTFLLSASDVACVITTNAFVSRIPQGLNCLVIDEGPTPDAVDAAAAADVSDVDRGGTLRPSHPAYIIYTSGSTGTPKGVVVSHASVLALFGAADQSFRFSEHDTWSVCHSPAFDVSVWEIWRPLLMGGRVVLMPAAVTRSAVDLVDVIARERVTVFSTTPSAFYELDRADALVERSPRDLAIRYVIFAGEKLNVERLREWHARHSSDGIELVNMYGITETTIHSTFVRISPDHVSSGESPIGRRLPHLHLYVLDDRLDLTPIGLEGEIYVAGGGLARGYLSRPRLTAERFVANPFGAPGSRMYRSGDLARWDPDLNLQFIGRVDQQVKIRGFRVEPGEVEAALVSEPDVVEAAVVAHQDPTGDCRLVAYVTSAADRPVDGTELRRRLRARLPDYLVPAVVTTIDRFPLNVNGKLDRRALPAPAWDTQQEQYRAPRTRVETVLCELIADLLGLDRVGLDDGFFELGGDSIMSMQLATRARDAGVVLTPREVFMSPTIELLAAAASVVDSDPGAGELSDEVWPLGPLQEGLLFHARLDRGVNDPYVRHLSLRLEGALDEESLRRAIAGLPRRHASLRAYFRSQAHGRATQLIAKRVTIPWDTVDWTTLSAQEQRTAMTRWLSADRQRGLDVSQPPLLRSALFVLGHDRFQLVLTFHHVLFDGWSIPVLVRELLALYDEGGEARTLPAAGSYHDYLTWLGGQDRPTAERAWRRALAGLIEGSLLVPERGAQAHVADEVVLDVSDELTLQLMRRARERGWTLNTIVQAAWALLLAQRTGRDDVVFGATVAGRPPDVPAVETLVGLFINTIPVRARVRPQTSLAALVTALKHDQAELFSYHHINLTELQRAIGVGPLFDTVVVFANYPIARGRLRDGARLQAAVEATPEPNHYPLSLLVRSGKQLHLRLNFKPSHISRAAVESMAGSLERALTLIALDPSRPIASVELLSREERTNVTEAWNRAREHITEALLPQRIAAHASKTPDAVAIVAGNGALSYGALEAEAERWAEMLATRGVGPETVVAVLVEPSLALPGLLLGILRAGAMYLPLDPSSPASRLRWLVRDSGARLVVANRRWSQGWPVDETPLVLIEELHESREAPARHTSLPLNRQQGAYLIYTSGSTGQPKGVVVTHEALATYLGWADRLYARNTSLGAPITTSLSFDATVTSLYLPLVSGQTVWVLPGDGKLDALADCARRRVSWTLWKVTPTHLRGLQAMLGADAASVDVRWLVVGGEALDPELVAFWRTHCPATTIVNEYGPTEATVGCCVHCIDGPAPAHAVPIGRPTPATDLYVLDGMLAPVPVGIVGELYLGGPQLARGYVGRPALTAERFVAHPWALGRRLYRTGDLVRWREDGQLLFVGRSDEQVKIRGVRVELGEVEAALRGSPGVSDAVAAVRQDSSGAVRLVGYVVPAVATTFDAAAVRQDLSTRLPEPLVPSAVVELSELPVTPHGKVNRRALPEPQWWAEPKSYRAPRTAMERLLCRLMAEVLDVPRVGLDEHFFEAGGDSIMAIQLASRAQDAGAQVTPRDLFLYPTVEQLAAVIGTHNIRDEGVQEASSEVPLTPIVRWLAERGVDDRFSQAVAVTLPIGITDTQVQAVVSALVARHESLRLQRVIRVDGTWQLVVGPAGAIPITDYIQRVVVSSLDPASRARARRGGAQRLAPAAGLMVQAVWLDSGPFRAGEMVMVAHHLAVDGVSWRILVHDMAAAWRAIERGVEPHFVAEGTSWRQWATRLAAEAVAPHRVAELPYWQNVLSTGADPSGLPPLDATRDVLATAGHTQREIATATASAVLTQMPRQWRASVHELLVATFALALTHWQHARGGSSDTALIDMEGHGRENVFPDVDPSRAVGWFTTLYPVRLKWSSPSVNMPVSEQTLATAVQSVKTQLRQIPDHGLGYGLLRYMNPDTAAVLARQASPRIAFNYLGRFDGRASTQPWSIVSDDSVLAGGRDDTTQLAHALTLNVIAVEGRDGPVLLSHWSWASSLVSDEAVQDLIDRWASLLDRLRDAATSVDVGRLTPADLSLVALTQAEIDRLEDLVGD